MSPNAYARRSYNPSTLAQVVSLGVVAFFLVTQVICAFEGPIFELWYSYENFSPALIAVLIVASVQLVLVCIAKLRQNTPFWPVWMILLLWSVFTILECIIGF